MSDERIETDYDEVLFTTRGSTWMISAPYGGPDLTGMGDRERAILRALLCLCLQRLDKAEQEVSLGVVRAVSS